MGLLRALNMQVQCRTQGYHLCRHDPLARDQCWNIGEASSYPDELVPMVVQLNVNVVLRGQTRESICRFCPS